MAHLKYNLQLLFQIDSFIIQVYQINRKKSQIKLYLNDALNNWQGLVHFTILVINKYLITITTNMISKIIGRTLRHISLMELRPLKTLPKFQCNFTTIKYKSEGKKHSSDEEKLWNQQQWEESVRWTDNIDQIVPNYPFTHIPVVVIRNPHKFNIPQQQLSKLVAFKALRAHQQDIALAAKILFPNPKDYEEASKVSNGKTLFSLYYGPKCKEMIKNLNLGEGSLKERITALLILNNMSNQSLKSDDVKLIDVRAISEQDSSGILVTYCLQLFIKFDLQYTHLLQLILNKLEDQQNTLDYQLKIAKAIITTPQFQNYFSRKILDLAISKITSSIPKMHNFQILFVIRNIYNYNSHASKQLAENLQQHLIKKHIDENSLDFHVPLILKSIKYSSKVGVSTKELLSFIETNMKRFQIIFDKKREAKGLFFSLLFSKPNKEVSPQLIGHLKGYFLNGLAEFVQSNESEQSQLMRFNKLLVKYFEHFSQKEQQYIKHQYIQKMIPYYSQSTQVLFYSILVYLRTKPSEEPSDNSKQHQVIKKHIQIFFQRCCNKSNAQQMFVVHHINSVIEMMYQVLRHNIIFHKSQMPLICKYDFSKKESVNPQNLSYFFYYLGKTQHESKQSVKAALLSVEPLLEVYIRGHKLHSFKLILNIIDVCEKVAFQHNFFYKMLENSLAQYLIKNPKFVVIDKDLRFINQKFIKRGYGSSRLKQLIIGSLEKPKNWEKLRNNYTQNQKKFLESVNRKRKERKSSQR